MAIEWKEEYDVGVEIFNEQHKGLFKIINKLYEAINSQKPGSDLDGVLAELDKYGKEHMGLEQEYFEKYNYPGAKEHVKEHDGFKAKIKSYRIDYVDKDIELTFELTDYLEDWLVNHINVIDKKYTEFFNDLGVN